MKKIFVIHENDEWIAPLKEAFLDKNIPHEFWFVDDLKINLLDNPPEGVFYNRMSASSHTRGHRFAPEISGTLLAWLESHERTIVNGRKALQLEIRKSEQYIALRKAGIKTPKTLVVNSIALLESAALELDILPFIIKPNRGGKGAGVQLIHSIESLNQTIQNDQLGESLDGIWLIQEYIKPQNDHITRVEFIGGKFYYAVNVDASQGFELCPADACQVDSTFCPAPDSSTKTKFSIAKNYFNTDLDKYSSFIKSNDIGIGAIEYAKDKNGIRYVYDVNTNTNYNRQAEIESQNNLFGMGEIADYLKKLLTEKTA